MTFDLRRVHLSIVRDLCERFHGYRSAGGVAAYAFAVFEDGLPVAAYAWQPPPPGAAKSVCPEAPHGVLALSRMVAVPKAERFLRHVSKPLRAQMKHEIDRTRWPVLVTYSDEGQGHTGYVYQCSGWEKTSRRRVEIRTDRAGARASRYSNGKTNGRQLTRAGHTFIQRWEHWACARGEAAAWIKRHGWARVPSMKVLRSGNRAATWARCGGGEGGDAWVTASTTDRSGPERSAPNA